MLFVWSSLSDVHPCIYKRHQKLQASKQVLFSLQVQKTLVTGSPANEQSRVDKGKVSYQYRWNQASDMSHQCGLSWADIDVPS